MEYLGRGNSKALMRMMTAPIPLWMVFLKSLWKKKKKMIPLVISTATAESETASKEKEPSTTFFVDVDPAATSRATAKSGTAPKEKEPSTHRPGADFHEINAQINQENLTVVQIALRKKKLQLLSEMAKIEMRKATAAYFHQKKIYKLRKNCKNFTIKVRAIISRK